MLMVLLLLNFFGFSWASMKFKVGNPFQIYFFVWTLIILSYAITEETWIFIPPDFIFLLITVAFFALSILSLSRVKSDLVIKDRSLVKVSRRMNLLVALLQVLVILGAPFAYLKATNLAGGESIFTVSGYIQLRLALTDEALGYGVWAYFFVLSYVVTSVTIFIYRAGYASLIRLIGSVAVSLFLTYLATGRTFVLLLMVMVIVPLVLDGVISYRGIVVSFLALVLLFLFVAVMTAKGVSLEGDAWSNFQSIGKNLRSYTVAPLLAFSTVVDASPAMTWGSNTFRFFVQLSNAFGITAVGMPSLIKGYAEVPDLTNVYTVYENYFQDFSYLGVFFPPLFLVFHFFLYNRAMIRGGGWVFLYSAMVYPLAMQFFQDQYFPLLSIWLQVCFWYWLIFRFQDDVDSKGAA